MKFSTAILALFASTVAAAPGGGKGGEHETSSAWTSSTCKAVYTTIPKVETKKVGTLELSQVTRTFV